jgi:hypothetical protein
MVVMRLHGRVRELETLVRRLELAASGRAQVVFVEGEAGIGKTCLVLETIKQARDRGFAVFHGRAEELERTRPFGALADALDCEHRSPDPARAALGRLLTGELEGALEAASSQFRVVDGFVELCELLADDGPVLLALEDLHWVDPTTLLAVRAIIRRLVQAPVLLLGSYRPAPVRQDLDRLVELSAEEGGCVLRLAPLSGDAVVALVAEFAGAAPGPRLCQQLDRAGGNPLFALELAKSLDQQGALRRADGKVDSEVAELPATLRLTILRRLRGLPETTVELLGLASILGSTLSLTDLARLAKRSAVELLAALREARAAGVLGEVGGQLAFRHDLVREAIYTDLPLPVRRGLHRDVGHALAAAGAPPVRVATHLALGADIGDAEAVAWLRRAARDAGSTAPGVRAAWSRRRTARARGPGTRPGARGAGRSPRLGGSPTRQRDPGQRGPRSTPRPCGRGSAAAAPEPSAGDVRPAPRRSGGHRGHGPGVVDRRRASAAAGDRCLGADGLRRPGRRAGRRRGQPNAGRAARR